MRRTPFTTGWQTRPPANAFAEMHGAAQPWRDVVLPHDATLGQPRDAAHGPASAYFPPTEVEYRAAVPVTGEDRDQVLALHFEGVYRSARVLVNGQLAASWASGWTEVVVPLGDHLRYDGTDEVRVLCRAGQDARWYAGAGIHRPVHLLRGPLVHLAHDGVRVVTEELDGSRAVVSVATTVVHAGRGRASRTLRVRLVDDTGAVVAEGSRRSPCSRASRPSSGSGCWSSTRRRGARRRRGCTPCRPCCSTGTPRPTPRRSPLVCARCRSTPSAGCGSTARRCCCAVRACTRQRRPGRGRDRPGRRAPGGAAEGGRLQRAAQRAQPDEPGDARCLRPPRRARHGRAHRHVDPAQDRRRRRRPLRRPLARPTSRPWSARTANHPSVMLYSIGNEIPELADPHGAVWSRRLAEKVRADGPHPVRHQRHQRRSSPSSRKRRGPQAAELGINTMLADMGEFMARPVGPELVAATHRGVLRRPRRRRHELHGRPLRARPRAVPQPGDRGHGDLPRADRPAVAAGPGPPARDRRLHLDRLGLPRRGRHRPGRRQRGPDRRRLPRARTRGCWPGAATSTSPATADRRRTTGRSCSGCAPHPYIAVHRPEHSGRTTASTPWAWADSVASWTWPAPRASRSTVEVYSDADEVELLLGDRRSAPRRRGRSTGSGRSSTVPWAAQDLVAVARTGGVETGRTGLHPVRRAVGLTASVDRGAVRADDADLAFVAVALVDGRDRRARGGPRGVGDRRGRRGAAGLGSAAPSPRVLPRRRPHHLRRSGAGGRPAHRRRIDHGHRDR